MTTRRYEADPRRAYRQWVKAQAQWQHRYEAFLQHQQQLDVVPTSPQALTAFLMAQHAAEQTLLAERPPFPAVCRDVRCGARTRQGTPCKRRDVYGCGLRCPLHGGLSTGPRTAAGKQRAAVNGLRPKRKRTP
jgi:hypothetical protein